jgi:hypothetical protein
MLLIAEEINWVRVWNLLPILNGISLRAIDGSNGSKHWSSAMVTTVLDSLVNSQLLHVNYRERILIAINENRI